MTIIAIDPGTAKIGIAVLDEAGAVLQHAVILAADLERELAHLLEQFQSERVVYGGSTGAARIANLCRELNIPATECDEKDSTYQARELYWEDHPPGGLRKLLPRGLLFPPVPLDDYAAILIGRRWLLQGNSKET